MFCTIQSGLPLYVRLPEGRGKLVCQPGDTVEIPDEVVSQYLRLGLVTKVAEEVTLPLPKTVATIKAGGVIPPPVTKSKGGRPKGYRPPKKVNHVGDVSQSPD